MRFLMGAVVLVAVAAYLAGSAALAMKTVAPAHSTIPVTARSLGSSYESVSFTSRSDRLTLRGWLFHAANSNGRSVVLVHGWKGNRTGLAPQAKDMIAHGYDALIFDTRGDGESSGDHQTLGALEERDVLGAYDFMRARGYAPPKMTVFGQSQGAVAVIEATPEMPDVGAVISDSSYADLSVLLAQQWVAATGTPGGMDFAGVNMARIFGLDPYLKPVDVVSSLPSRAFLFFHASGDTFIPVANANSLRAASSNPRSHLFVFPGKAHIDTYTQNPAQYMTDVYAFIESQVVAR